MARQHFPDFTPSHAELLFCQGIEVNQMFYITESI